jgi:hypothetical protein
MAVGPVLVDEHHGQVPTPKKSRAKNLFLLPTYRGYYKQILLKFLDVLDVWRIHLGKSLSASVASLARRFSCFASLMAVWRFMFQTYDAAKNGPGTNRRRQKAIGRGRALFRQFIPSFRPSSLGVDAAILADFENSGSYFKPHRNFWADL